MSSHWFQSAVSAVRSNSSVTEVIVAVTALTGVFALYAESRRGKNIAMGELILNLNSEFDTNEDRVKIHEKIISGERLNDEDKPALVTYLTFFEIVYRLIVSRVVKMEVVDDLFRSRFFRAVHHLGVQDLELLPDADGYRNIYKLEELWLAYLAGEGIELQRGDRRLPASAVLRSQRQVHFSSRELCQEDASQVHGLIVRAAMSMPPQAFVVNDLNTLEKQMGSGLTIVAERKGFDGPVGVLHVYFPGPDESLARHAQSSVGSCAVDHVAHMDIAAVLPEHRGYGLLSLLLIDAESRLRKMHPERRFLFATVHPDNGASLRSFEFVGFERMGAVEIHGSLPRILLAKQV